MYVYVYIYIYIFIYIRPIVFCNSMTETVFTYTEEKNG